MSQDTAREVVDEAFARAWASWRSVGQGICASEAWCSAAALERGVPGGDVAAARYPCPTRDGLDQPAARRDSPGLVDPWIMSAFMRLPARQRQVVALRLILDLDTARTGSPWHAPGTVMAHLGRAMAALRHDLEPELQQENRS